MMTKLHHSERFVTKVLEFFLANIWPTVWRLPRGGAVAF
jgi:hypothetical protein